MAQRKKKEVAHIILQSAAKEFRESGYAGATLANVAQRAGCSTSNIYIYFPSKMALFMAVFDPWFRQKIHQVLSDAVVIHDNRLRLKTLLVSLWRTIPLADNGFANNLMQALALLRERKEYSNRLLRWSEAQLKQAIGECLSGHPTHTVNLNEIVHLIFMASDGFTLHERTHAHSKQATEKMAEVFCDLLLGPE